MPFMADVVLSDSQEQPEEVVSQGPEQSVSLLFVVLLALASLVMWMGLIPLTQTIIPLHVSSFFAPGDQARYGSTSLLQALGGLSAMIVYPVVGALSDRTFTRLGRRRPWILGGVIGAALLLVAMANAPTYWLLALCWIGFCICANMTQSSLFTMLPDKVPVRQRAKVAALFGLMAPVGIVAGTVLASKLGRDAFYYVIAAVELIGVTLFVLQLHEDRPDHEIPTFRLKEFLTGFWINPRLYPDFAWTWWARVLFILGYATTQNYLIFFLQDTGLFSAKNAGVGVATFQAFSTIGLLLGSFGTGYFSDRLQRRKPFAIVAGACVAVALLVIAFVRSWPAICGCAFIFGLGFGIYSATEVALGTQVLTSRRSHGKDMGVLSLGGNIPQTLSPLYASFVITQTHSYTLLYCLAAIPPMISSWCITRIKHVK